MGFFFPIGLAVSFFASLAGWIPNLVALVVASALMFVLGVLANGEDRDSGSKYGCLFYLLLNVGLIIYIAFDAGIWTWKVILDAAVLALVLLLSSTVKSRR